jgi:hypothetical protein
MSVNTIAFEVFKDKKIQEFIIDLNTEGQLFAKGVGVDGRVVGVYSLATESISKGKSGKGFPKIAGRPYNFYAEGDLFKSFRIKVTRDGFIIDAETDDLIDDNIIDNDKQILGLTRESKIKLVKEITPLLVKEAREQAIK